MDEVTNGQRAMWMVLITSLAAPFFASLIDVAGIAPQANAPIATSPIERSPRGGNAN